jgi:hypothetical protein
MCHRGGYNLDGSTPSTGNTDRTPKLVRQEWEGFSMSFRPNQTAIDEIVASCNGDLHGALQALLMVNEHLEAELAKLYAAAVYSGLTERGNGVLH